MQAAAVRVLALCPRVFKRLTTTEASPFGNCRPPASLPSLRRTSGFLIATASRSAAPQTRYEARSALAAGYERMASTSPASSSVTTTGMQLLLRSFASISPRPFLFSFSFSPLRRFFLSKLCSSLLGNEFRIPCTTSNHCFLVSCSQNMDSISLRSFSFPRDAYNMSSNQRRFRRVSRDFLVESLCGSSSSWTKTNHCTDGKPFLTLERLSVIIYLIARFCSETCNSRRKTFSSE